MPNTKIFSVVPLTSVNERWMKPMIPKKLKIILKTHPMKKTMKEDPEKNVSSKSMVFPFIAISES